MTLTINLRDRRALVTGAGQGVGRGIALALGSAGAHVVVNDLDPARAAAVVEEVRESGGSSSALVFDVTDHDAVTRSVPSLDPGVDILVNNAGSAGKEGFSFEPSRRRHPTIGRATST